MIFKISSFLTLALALALSSLDAATASAISAPRSVDGGQLNRRDGCFYGVNITRLDTGFSGGPTGSCGLGVETGHTVVFPMAESDRSHCGQSITITPYIFGGTPLNLKIIGGSNDLQYPNVRVDNGAFLQLNNNNKSEDWIYGQWCPGTDFHTA